MFYEWWDNSSVACVTGAIVIIKICFICTSSKCPNVFLWSLSMSQTHSFYIKIVYCNSTIVIVGVECIWTTILVSFDLPTHSGVLDSVERECGGHTATPWSATCPFWWCNQSESWRAVLVGISHVKVGHPHPASCAVTASPGHVTVLQVSISSSSILNPVVSWRRVLLDELTRRSWTKEWSQGRVAQLIFKSPNSSFTLEMSVLTPK